MRWISIRRSDKPLLFSSLLEFQAFTAAITLLLGLLIPPRSTSQEVIEERHKDFQLVDTVVNNLKSLKQHGSGMAIGTQSISIIHTLQEFISTAPLPHKLRLEIPFFGVLRIARGGTVQPLEGGKILGANASQNAPVLRPAQSTALSSVMGRDYTPTLRPDSEGRMTQETVDRDRSSNNCVWRKDIDTLLHFSGGHLRLPEVSGTRDDFDTTDWSFQESDMIFFDSLVDTDLAGSWML